MLKVDGGAAQWRRSGRCSDTSYCVEVALTHDGALMRDAKDPGGGQLAFDPQAWGAFVDDIKRGRFDR